MNDDQLLPAIYTDTIQIYKECMPHERRNLIDAMREYAASTQEIVKKVLSADREELMISQKKDNSITTRDYLKWNLALDLRKENSWRWDKGGLINKKIDHLPTPYFSLTSIGLKRGKFAISLINGKPRVSGIEIYGEKPKKKGWFKKGQPWRYFFDTSQKTIPVITEAILKEC